MTEIHRLPAFIKGFTTPDMLSRSGVVKLLDFKLPDTLSTTHQRSDLTSEVIPVLVTFQLITVHSCSPSGNWRGMSSADEEHAYYLTRFIRSRGSNPKYAPAHKAICPKYVKYVLEGLYPKSSFPSPHQCSSRSSPGEMIRLRQKWSHQVRPLNFIIAVVYGVSIQDIMLNDENRVKENRDV